MDNSLPEKHAARADTYRSISSSSHRAITIVAERAAAAAGSIACSIAWHEPRGAGFVYAPADRRWRAAIAAAHALAERQLDHLPSLVDTTRLQPGRLAGAIDERLTNGLLMDGIGLRISRDGVRLTLALVAPRGRQTAELEAIVRIAGDSVLAVLERDAALGSRDFWMTTASANGAHLAHARAELDATVARRSSLQNAIAYCGKLRPPNRFAGLGALFAKSGAFEAWLIALPSEGGMAVLASSGISKNAAIELGDTGPIAESVARQQPVKRTGSALSSSEPAPASAEDRLFQEFTAYVCIPCGRTGVALAARHQIDENAIKEIELLANWLTPVVEKWLLESEIDRLQKLVHTLGVRMFRAVDVERRRVARDLHDQSAQLISAARIALETDLAMSRDILMQLDDSLRKYLRRLRTPALPRCGLSRALRDELGRLTAAGITGQLVHPERIAKLPRMIQEVCYQVTREALSNVIRHSKASRVEISAELRKGMVVLRIDDDGKGPPAAGQRDRSAIPGWGLAGLAERLELMGGRLKLQRLSGITRLSAEIPGL